ncbi:class I SAM-dependent methyltransferase [Candidatus Microgenomates bacterium]|nr:class I SAM-dependent methyltransferase [Candidatus Microgenomates bacterium]
MKIIKRFLEVLVGLFFTVYFLFNKKNKIPKTLEETINLYKGEGFGELFSQIRAWDAPYEPIDKLIAKNAKVLDLGSGDGLLGNYLALSSSKRKVSGIELNKDRAKSAYRKIKNTHFRQGNILKVDIGRQDVVILAHVLHHLPSKLDQEKLLSKISNALSKNKELIILEIDYKPFFKYIFSWLTDAITVPILFEGKIFTNQFFYRKRDDWKKLLTSLGFVVKIKPIHNGMPFSHVLIYAKKK